MVPISRLKRILPHVGSRRVRIPSDYLKRRSPGKQPGTHFHPNPQTNLQTLKAKKSKERHNLLQNPIYQKGVATNVGRAFLKLKLKLDVEIP